MGPAPAHFGHPPVRILLLQRTHVRLEQRARSLGHLSKGGADFWCEWDAREGVRAPGGRLAWSAQCDACITSPLHP